MAATTWIFGGPGSDVIVGGSGDDELRPDAGQRPRLRGSGQRQHPRVRRGHFDNVDCGPGHDTAYVDKDEHTRHCERVKHR
jgi:Ca2+-binding RTX toxin-like protein